MRETADDLARLQSRLDESFATAGSHLQSIFSTRANAEELVEWLQGIIEVHLAVVSTDGAPLVAPIDAAFYKGDVWFGLPAMSARTPLVRRNPRVSASYTDGPRALIVHGTAERVDPASDAGQQYDAVIKELYVAAYGEGWLQWHAELQKTSPASEAFSGRIVPRKIFAKLSN